MSQATTNEKLEFISSVGGRVSAPKSAGYARAVLEVEGRANQFLARHMLATDLAYVLTATELGVTPEAEARKLLSGLLDLLPRAEELGRSNTYGDIVLQREVWVANEVGKETAYWLHVARNRGESLRALLPRMFFRDALFREQAALRRLIRALVDRSQPVMEAVAPFYHHMQHAGRTTLGECLLSWATYYHRHLDWIAQADKHLDIAPPPNCGRDIVIELVGRVGKRMGLSKSAQLWQTLLIPEEQFSDPMFVFVQINVALARLSYDLLIWMTSEFDFFELADEHASVSSGRPQKKNPFGFQTIISGASVGAGRLAAQLTTSVTMSEELNSTFHASSLYQYAHDVIAWTEFMADVIEKCTFNLEELEKKSTLGGAGAREALDVLVYEHKVPYRFAHHALGAVVRESNDTADHQKLVELLRARLKDYPDLDYDELVRTTLATSKAHMMLNLPAFREAHRSLDESLRALDSANRPNPTEASIERVVAEVKQFLARQGSLQPKTAN